MIRLILTLLISCLGVTTFAAPAHFQEAKKELRHKVYHDRNTHGDAYCGCNWEWTGATGGRTDLASCGYKIRAQKVRAERIEWEHVVPASQLGRQRQCWQEGGRKNCTSNDPVFSIMEADMHNLTPVVGEINADRSNYNFGALPKGTPQYGSCDFQVDFSQRTAQPPASFRGAAARIYFYMADRYDLNLSRQQQQLFMAWHKQHPPSAWERERDRRIAGVMGHSNPFVTGDKTWSLGHKNSKAGLNSENSTHQMHPSPNQTDNPVHGNKNSKIYHLPKGCPSYNAMKASNKIIFNSEQEAINSGYQKAGNCR